MLNLIRDAFPATMPATWAGFIAMHKARLVIFGLVLASDLGILALVVGVLVGVRLHG